MRTLVATLLLALALAPIAAAQEQGSSGEPASDPQRPDDAAWTEDCPPDMMCAAGGPDCAQPEWADKPECEPCMDCEVYAYGPEDCIECSGPVDGPKTDGSCMDGSSSECQPDVQYLDGRGPEDCENCRGNDVPQTQNNAENPDLEGGAKTQDKPEEKDVPAPGVAVAVLALAGVALLAVGLRARK